MRRFIARIASILAGVLLLGSVALAATPVKNGLYNDKTHHVLVALAGTNVVTPQVICHGQHYYPSHGLFLKSGGRFSYSGKAYKANGPQHPPAPTKTNMSVSGTFKTAHLVTGKAKVGGCTVQYSAKYVRSHP
jgi:hypothetical protein